MRGGAHHKEDADHLPLRFQRHRDEGFHQSLLDHRQKRRIRVFREVIANAQRLAAGDNAPTQTLSGPNTNARRRRAPLPGQRPDHKFLAVILTERQAADIGLQKRASAPDDEIEGRLQSDLRTDLLSDLVERGNLGNLSSERVFVPFQGRGHVVERLGQSPDLVLGFGGDRDVAAPLGDLVCRSGKATDRAGQSPQAVAGQEQRAQEAGGGDDKEADGDELRAPLEVGDRIDKVEDDGALECRGLLTPAWLIDGDRVGHHRTGRRNVHFAGREPLGGLEKRTVG